MNNLVGSMVGLLLLMASFAFAQNQQLTVVYRPIVVSNLDKVLGDARMSAFRTKDPEVEFVQVKLCIKDYVAQHRLSDSQEVQFSSPDRFKSWLKDVAGRTGRQESELRHEIVQSMAPNGCPELTGAVKQTFDYYRDRAVEELAHKRSKNADGLPANPSGAASAEQTLHEEPLLTAPEESDRDEDAPRAVHAISGTNTTAPVFRIEIEVLPAAPPSSTARNRSAAPKRTGSMRVQRGNGQ